MTLNNICTLGYEALDCYGPAFQKNPELVCTESEEGRNRLLELLLTASAAKSKDEFSKKMDDAIAFSSTWNKHQAQLTKAKESCDFDHVKGFFIKVRWRSGIFVPERFNVHYATLFRLLHLLSTLWSSLSSFLHLPNCVSFFSFVRNPVHHAVSLLRAGLGVDQFHANNQTFQLFAQPTQIKEKVSNYINHWTHVVSWVNTLHTSTSTINYEDIRSNPAHTIRIIFADMDLPTPSEYEAV